MRRHRDTAWALGAATLALALAGCTAGGDRRLDPAAPSWPGTAGAAPTRRFAVEEWDTLWSIGVAADDPRMVQPYWVQASRAGVYVFDAGTQRLLALDAAGRERWSFGREGAGPEEFRNVRDVKAAGDSAIYLLDPRNSRITVLGAGGTVTRRIPLRQVGPAEQVVPLAGGGAVLVGLRPDTPLVAVDAAGRRMGAAAFPWRGFARLHPLATQGVATASPDGRRWVFGFMLGDGWVPFDGLRHGGFFGRFVDHRPFPVVEVHGGSGSQSAALAQYYPCTGCDLVAADSSLYVLAGGSDRTLRAVVDRFRMRDGRYLSSFRLPVHGRRLAVLGSTFYVVVDEPYPGIIALRPRPAPPAR